jgi:cold shock CspA family protein
VTIMASSMSDGTDADERTVTISQATVWSFDESTHDGQVVLDDGARVSFGADAFAAGGLRLLRPGQRVRVELVDGIVRRIVILTLP